LELTGFFGLNGFGFVHNTSNFFDFAFRFLTISLCDFLFIAGVFYENEKIRENISFISFMEIIKQDRQLWNYLSDHFQDDAIGIVLIFCEKRLLDYHDNPGYLHDQTYRFKTWKLFTTTCNKTSICAFDWRFSSESEIDEESESESESESEYPIQELELHFFCYPPCIIDVYDDDEPIIRQYLAQHCPTFRAEIDIQRPVTKKRKNF
jgi:hypothetical protein